MTDKVASHSFLPSEPLWFLVCLFWCRLFAFIWLKKWRYEYFIKILAIIIWCLISYYEIDSFSLMCAVISLPFFLTGVYFKKFFLLLAKTSDWLKILLLTASIIIVLLWPESKFGFASGSVYGNILIAFIRGICGTMAVFVIATYTVKLPNAISAYISSIGAATLVVLTTHYYILIPGKVIYSLFGLDSSQVHILYASILAVICLCISPWIYNVLKQKFPIMIGK